MTHHATRRNSAATDEGIALVSVLGLMLVASLIGGSLMILAQTETYGSLNYRSMTQARYAAESGIHKAANYLLYTYPQPGSAADPLANYDLTVSPVRYNGQPVVLSATTGVASNYPVAATQTAFNNAVKGTLAAGGASLNYSASATLMSMRQLFSYGSVTPTVAQTWLITGDGTTAGSRPATVEVTTVLEQQLIPYTMYGLFATNNGCGSLSLSGGVSTDSYDSSSFTLSGGKPVTQSWGGNVGTNGNLDDGGGSIVNGSLSTPRTGVGNCKNGSVDALTLSGKGSSVSGGLVQLPQPVTYPTPALPSPLPPTGNVTVNGSTTCAGLPAGAAAVCTGAAGNLVLTPGGAVLSLADWKLSGGTTMHFNAGTYNINSISLSGNSSMVVDSGPVVFDVVGSGSTNPVDFSGGTISNSTFVPSKFQVIYAGTDGVQISGGATSSLMVFAPNASLNFSGGSDVYGSFIGATIKDTGGTAIHYDRKSPQDFGVLSNAMLSAFSWKKF